MKKKKHKYIFVIGGVMSGVGKGIAASSLSKILQSRGFIINPIKIDPYLNVDAGTMNPTEHGETFVLSSGLECDQDMGNYERFLGVELKEEDYITSGMVYSHVIERERSLKYGGKCVEAVPHIRDEIVRRIEIAADLNGSNISVVEIGGTIGDFQNALFMEAARVMHMKNPQDVLFIMVSYLPIPGKLGEMKTKPTQNAVRQLNSYGIQPDIVIARSEVPIDKKRKEKIAIWCNVRPEHVISAPDIKSIYDVPLNFEKDHLDEAVLDLLGIPKKRKKSDLKLWKAFVKKTHTAKKEVHIAIVGKYFDTGDFVLSDAYLSVIEAIKFSAYGKNLKPVIHWINSKKFEKKGGTGVQTLAQYNGIIIPGGFGETGIDGKLRVIQYARENKIPYLGLCYGMQLAVIEYARNVAGIKGANTTEIDVKAKDLVIDVMSDQRKKINDGDYGGTMRLGSYPAYLKRGTLARKYYKAEIVEERHRHRYEVNPSYVSSLEEAGMVFSGVSPDGVLMEIVELPKEKHPFFLGTQFHPEFKARPLDPHPLFSGFIEAASLHKRKEKKVSINKDKS